MGRARIFLELHASKTFGYLLCKATMIALFEQQHMVVHRRRREDYHFNRRLGFFGGGCFFEDEDFNRPSLGETKVKTNTGII